MADDGSESPESTSQGKWSWDIQKIPCARESLLFGISSGLVIGSAVFIKTKIVRKACDYAVGTFAVLSFTSWEICSYQRYRKRQKVREAVGMLNEYEQKRKQGMVEGEPTEA
ncbi:cytochrome c oxidase assembly protein COX20, mitochondrial-like isoform X1 [Dendronephthya gigantea]|uniref:cytochrome c oxidase assembly protein COX20, mitochondrial-like isoform X1 n=1 Tax=Dendronephthya gigantea TaxID=151771 RepID=UPI00106AA0BF|nr:cytochrome c oxidase assembly protein COX20, mitochondrial-like isoform X1 [Dendronephthya gigantea]